MRLWNYCAICGKRIEVGEACLGIEKKNTEIVGDSICFDCVKVENIPGREESVPITDLLARAEAAEAENSQLDGTVETLMESNRLLSERCARLEEARENANEACAKWEALCHMAEQERDQYKAALQNWHEEG